MPDQADRETRRSRSPRRGTAWWRALSWLAVVLCDLYLRRRQPSDQIEHLLFNRKHTNWAGPVAMLAGMGLSIWLFSNQTEYVGVVPGHVPAVGDITFEVGFVITAAIYLTWHAITDRQHAPAASPGGVRA